MGNVVMGAVVWLDGFIADDNDDVGWSFPGTDDQAHSTQASADFMRSHYRDVAAVVIGRRLFDLTNGWNGKPAAGEHVFVVTHQPPTGWEHAGTAPFTFATGALAEPLRLENPTTIVPGDRVTHLVYDISR